MFGLFGLGETWLGHPALSDQHPRSFRLNRINDLTILPETFEIPPQFDLQAYLATNPFFQGKLRVRLYFAPESSVLAYNDRFLN